MKIIIPALAIFTFGLPFTLWGDGVHDFPLALSRVQSVRVVSVLDGNTVVLDDTRQVRLVGIQAPKLPLAKKAKILLSALLLKRNVKLYPGTMAQDRYGRVLAQVVRTKDGLWLQGAMLKAGLARVSTLSENPALAAALLKQERQARAAGRGIWGLPYYAIRTPETVRPDTGSFQIVEGRVKKATQVRKWIYLNFGTNWRTDFTVKINARYEKTFLKRGLDPLTLTGKRIRVRGWVRSENGPMIALEHPEQLEMIGKNVKVPR